MTDSNCLKCPHRGSRGNYGMPRMVPTCKTANRDLDFTINREARTLVLGPAPEWCPAEDRHPCWNCNVPVSMDERGEADGECPHCSAELDLETWPVQAGAKK